MESQAIGCSKSKKDHMNRAQILWLESIIAVSGAVFWSMPPALPHGKIVLVGSLFWFTITFSSIFIEALEDWGHRLSSFLGFLLCTIEGILGLLAFSPKSGLLVMSLLHGIAFILAVIGKYKSRNRRRPRRNFEEIAEEAIREAKKAKVEAEAQSESEDSEGA